MISIQERNLQVRVPSVCCDGCGKCLDRFGDSLSIQLTRTDERSMDHHSFVWKIDGFANTKETAVVFANYHGWKQEVIFGDTLVFCPNCQKL